MGVLLLKRCYLERISAKNKDVGMIGSITIPKLADDIRQIYAADLLQADPSIETYLDSRLRSFSAEEKIIFLKKLIREFNISAAASAFNSALEEEVITKLSSLVLGQRVSEVDLSSEELLPRLAESLNTIFDKLNQLVGLINSTFNSQFKGNETIRQVIGVHLEGEDKLKSLESYLGQINKAFLVTQESFKAAAKKIVAVVLRELDPDKIGKSTESKLKFGPLRKAEIFEIYESKYKICRKWYESGRFMADLLREFEKNCQQKSL
jgi:hypothetical protein